jgi:hypothetical protein
MLALIPRPTIYNPEDGAWDSGKTLEDLEDEMRFWPRIMFGDMGTQSGVSIVWFHPLRLTDVKMPTSRSILAHWSSYLDGPENDQAREFCRLARGMGGQYGLRIGLEKFIVNRISKEETFLSSPRIAAKIEFALWSGVRDYDDEVRRRNVTWQMPSEIEKGQVGDQRLKMLNLYRPGPDHINDSMKHCLQHLKSMRHAGFGMFEKMYGFDPAWRNV